MFSLSETQSDTIRLDSGSDHSQKNKGMESCKPRMMMMFMSFETYSSNYSVRFEVGLFLFLLSAAMMIDDDKCLFVLMIKVYCSET